jgi:hypothetical protein
MMRCLNGVKLALALALTVAAGNALAAGFLTNGLPAAVAPLTGNETLPADTNLPQGLNPASEAVTLGQLSTWLRPTVTTNTSTSAATATAAQMAPTAYGQQAISLLLTGTLSGAANLTTPTAAQIVAAVPLPVGGATGSNVGSSWVIRINNESSGAYAWTLVAGSGITLPASVNIPQYGSKSYLVTIASASSVTFADLGN